MDSYISRTVKEELLTPLGEYPIVTILGPRQAGKTTFAKEVAKDFGYINMELPENRSLAAGDPKTFLNSLPAQCIIDEIQRIPELLSYIQVRVDESQVNGQFILTGSHQLELSQSISQSLAGRTALLNLLPLSMQELQQSDHLPNTFEEIAFRGFLPRVYSQNQRPSRAYANYYQTYVERDVRQLINLKDTSLFEKFIKLLAGRVGQPMNYNSLGNDVGVDQKTIKHWLSILEVSYVIFKLPPFFQNFGKRVIKSPKYYFIDVGLLVYLLGIEEPEQISRDPLVGSIFENLVIIEILKARFNQGKEANLYFYRDSTGKEVDLLVPDGRALRPIEIKSAATFTKSFLQGIERFKQVADYKGESWIVYTGEGKLARENVTLRNFKDVGSCI